MKIRNIIVALIMAIVCLLFTGCSSYVSVYRTDVTGDTYTCAIDIFASKDDLAVLESKNRKMEEYLGLLANACNVAENGGVLEIIKDEEGNLYGSFVINVDASSISKDEYSVNKEEGFFFNTHTIRFKNPLDKFKDAYKNGISSKPAKSNHLYLIWVILHGEVGIVDSFSNYFGVEQSIANELALNFLIKTHMLYTSDAPTEYVLTQKYFKWTTTVESADGYVEYTVKSVNSWAWYVLAIVIGYLVALVLWLIARKSKKQPQLVDNTELEKLRMLKNSVPPHAKVVTQNAPNPPDTEVFDGEAEDKKKE